MTQFDRLRRFKDSRQAFHRLLIQPAVSSYERIDIPVPEKLPTRISPCPIVEAILEIRFVTEKGWTVLPGLLHQHIRDRYGEPTDLPLAAIPDEVRRGEASLTHRPLAAFEGDGFQIRFGPRVLSLIVSSEYPGWSAVESELGWLLDRVAEAGFIVEGFLELAWRDGDGKAIQIEFGSKESEIFIESSGEEFTFPNDQLDEAISRHFAN
ncbi:MAG: TIGR04255 family protein [Verrucomicrobiales bacterium]